MKTSKIYAVALAISCLTACSNDASLKPVSKKVNGPLGKFYEVVDRDYKIADGSLSVEFKRVDLGGPEDASWTSSPTFCVELLDKDGNVVSTQSTDVVYQEEQLEAVFSLDVDESASITFHFDKTNGAVKFKVTSKWDKNAELEEEEEDEDILEDGDEDESLEDDEDETTVSAGSEDWDALLDSYDSCVTKYISLMKKAAKGDLSALAEYPSLLEKAEDFSNKMENAEGDMSASQWERYMKITAKMATAATQVL